MDYRRNWLRSLVACAVFVGSMFATPHPLHAQASTSATISGTVVDPSGAVISNADVTLKNLATGDVRHSKSNGAGDFTSIWDRGG